MEKLRIHPYLGALTMAAFVIIVGTFVVAKHASAPLTENSPSAWQGNGLPSIQTITGNGAQSSSIMQEVQQNAPYSYPTPTLPPAIVGASSTQALTPIDSTGSFDYASAIRALAQKAQGGASLNSSVTTANAYAFIPTGLISTTSVSHASRTKTQQDLYTYGNDVGSIIQNFEAQHTGMISLLRNAFSDRQDASKAARVSQIGQAYISLGNEIAGIDSVPTAAATYNNALAQSYISIGKELITVSESEASADAVFVDSIKSYNASADTLNKNFVALAQFFASYGVTFANGDPGAEFVFTNSAL